MPLNVVVVGADSTEERRITLDDYEIVPTMGESEDQIATRISDILRAISESVSGVICGESELTVELSGSVALKADGKVKWLFLNLGGGATQSNALKVVLKTRINPTVGCKTS